MGENLHKRVRRKPMSLRTSSLGHRSWCWGTRSLACSLFSSLGACALGNVTPPRAEGSSSSWAAALVFRPSPTDFTSRCLGTAHLTCPTLSPAPQPRSLPGLPLFTHSFISRIFAERLFCARPCSRHQGDGRKRDRQSLSPPEFIIQWGCTQSTNEQQGKE